MNPLARLAVPMIIGAAGLFFVACNGGNEVKVVDQNFQDEIADQQNLRFSFNKDIYPDSLLRTWDSTEYISFEPKVRGAYQWVSSSELEFSPGEGFKPGTDYKASLNSSLLKYAQDKQLKVQGKDIRFHTAPLRVTGYSVAYARAQGSTSTQLDLQFNYPVQAAQAASKIRLTSKGQNVVAQNVSTGAGKTVSLQFQPLAATDEEAQLNIEVQRGIAMQTGDYKTKDDTTIKASVPSRYTLRVNDISSSHSGTDATITLATSQPLPPEGLQSLITIEPAVAFSVEPNANGLSITSTEMKPDQTYQLTLSDKLEGTLGGRLKEPYSEQITFGKLEPVIKFTNTKGMYLSSRGYKNLALQIVGESQLEVTIIKVYENNLEHFFRGGSDYGYDYDDEGNEGGSYDYYNTENFGDTIDHKFINTDKLPALNAARILHLDFQDKLRGWNGVYVVNVASKEHRWVQSSKVLCLSDIGLIVKEDKENVYVFANSIREAKPMGGVNVGFISTNNQRMWQGTTDGDGVCTFSRKSLTQPQFRLGMVTARKNDEFSFIQLERAGIETSRFDVGGRMPNATGLNAMLYGERNIYRPGEVAHVSCIVRNESWDLPGEVPLKLKLTMPNGKEFATMRKILNGQGSCETAFPIPYTAITGTYTLDVLSGNDVLLNSYAIAVEDFMPDRIKSTLTLDKKEATPGDAVTARVQADNLFGTPAMNRDYEMELNIEKQEFESKDFKDYRFGLKKDFYFETIVRNGATNEQGSATETFVLGGDGSSTTSVTLAPPTTTSQTGDETMAVAMDTAMAPPMSPPVATPSTNTDQDLSDNGLLRGSIHSTVFDETGRPVHRYEKFDIYTQPYFIGIKDDADYVATRQPVKIPLIALDKTGKPQNGVKVQITVLKKEWHTAIEQSGDHYRYVSSEETKTIGEYEQTINGTGTYFAFTPTLSGDYEVQIALDGSSAYVSKTLYAWGAGSSDYTSFEVNNEGNVTIQPDKEKYARGEKVKLLFTTPFEGRMLVTLERDKMLEHHYLTTENKSASLTIDANEALVPNVYVTATLFRPMDGADNPLTVAHGFRNVQVEDVKTKLPVTVTMNAASRSKTKQAITVKTTPGAYVTIAAVDEGILQIKNYETPDPWKYFYQKVALAMQSYDIYPLLLPEIKTTMSSTGGDGGGESNGRVNPLFVNRVKNVSFWSGIVQADGSGTVRWNIDVPQFSGDIRVMAVAYKGKAFGGADQHMKVADPIVISAALPRVLSPKDQVSMGITVTNTTAKDATATVRVETKGPLGISGAATQQLTIPANREGHVVVPVTAQNSIGAGNVKVSVTAMGETFTNETDIAVRPPASLQKRSGSGVVQAGQTIAVNAAAPYMAGSGGGKLIVGKSPLVQFSKNMDYLVHYPYGCIEQTVSAAFPQIYYADLAKALTGVASSDPNPSYNVQQAIAKVQGMQLSNGGLAYWPSLYGGGEESWWGSVYAAHFLLEARKAGYEVNDATLDRLLQYLRFKLQKRPTEVLYYNQSLSREIAAKETAYSLYVLALAGQPQAATMNYYKGNPKFLAIDSRYLLGAAYAISGNPQGARQITPPQFGGEQANQAFGGSFYSYTRDLGISLSALIDINPQDPQVAQLSRNLSQQLMRQPYLNTQENVWGILALGKLARISNQTSGSAAVKAGGKSLGSTDGPAFTLDLKNYLGQPLSVSATGKGQFYYFWETSGITADGSFIQEDAFLKVRRTYYDRNGREIVGGQFAQNQLIVVRLRLESSNNQPVENVVVTDMLPAGFEIENTRLNDLPELKWIKDQATPDYLDYRDDRLNLFTDAGAPQDFYYMVRAVSPGTFVLGPVQADAMYNGAYHSYWGAGTVVVR